MKKIMIFILTFVILMQMTVLADDKASWSFENGVLTVWGNSENYSNSSERPWDKHIKDVKKLVIKDGVTSIGNWSFANFDKLS